MDMGINKEKAIDKIKKILAKTKSNSNAFESEVEGAMLKAQEMLVKYGLTMSDVANDEEVSQEKEILDSGIYTAKRLTWWEKYISTVVARNFRCDSIIKMNGKSTICFIGIKEDVDIATQMYFYAKESISYLSDCYIINRCNENNMAPLNKRPEHLRKFTTLKDFKSEKNSYIEGFIDGLDDKFREQIKKNDWGLILVKDEAVTEYTNALKPKKGRSSKIKTSIDNSHYNTGYSDGHNLEYRNDLLK